MPRTVGLSAGLQLLVVYVPVLNRAFGTVAIGAADWGICICMASLVLWVDEAWQLMIDPLEAPAPLEGAEAP